MDVPKTVILKVSENSQKNKFSKVPFQQLQLSNLSCLYAIQAV